MATTDTKPIVTNIVGEGFPEEIIKQIDVRQKKKGLKNRNLNGNPQNLVWQNSNTGWVKLISSVDILQSRYEILKKNLQSNIPLQEQSQLAREFVLMGGVYNQNKTQQSGIARDKTTLNNNAYGLGGVEFGLSPMPGITSFSIKTETRGSLKTATIGIKAYNRTQFDIINMLYMSLGYSVLVEWGNTMYYKNDGTFEENNQFSLADDFLNGTYTWTDILPKIQEQRLASNGNYDAALCKVVNFTWSIDKDLSYNITVTLRTIGDVIESLKMNTLSGDVEYQVDKFVPFYDIPFKNSPTVSAPFNPLEQALNPIQQSSTLTDKITAWANSTDIGRLLYNVQQRINNQPLSSDISCINLWKNVDHIDAVSIDYEGAPDGKQYYIRLGYFLDILQSNIFPKVKKNNLSIISILTKYENNIIATYDRQISADPRVCLIKSSFDRPTTKVEFLPGAEDFFKSFDKSEYKYGYFMNVYFNMQYIIDRMVQLTDKEGKLVLIDFLKIFSDGFCRSTGNYNKIEPTVDDEHNVIKFIDETPIPDRDNILKQLSPKVSTELVEFQLFGYNQLGNNSVAGIIRDLNFTTTVTPNLSMMITTGAQANGYITGQDSTALSTLNNGLVDRVKEEFVNPLTPASPAIPQYVAAPTQVTTANAFSPFNNFTPPQETKYISPIETKYKEPLDAFQKFIGELGIVDKKAPNWNPSVINNFLDSNVAFCEYDQYKSTVEKKQKDPNASSPIIGFIPFNLSLTIDGLSGMKVYQKFSINSQFLPSNYPTTLEFIIKGITNEIRDNQWITIIESLAIPKNPFTTKITRKKTTTNFTASPLPNKVFVAENGQAKTTAEQYLGRTLSDIEWNQLVRATAAESSPNPKEQAYVMAVILNRVKNNYNKYGPTVTNQLYARGQFLAVTGTSNNNFEKGPSPSSAKSLYDAIVKYLPSVPHTFKFFTSNLNDAYRKGAGENIKFKNVLLSRNGIIIGNTIFSS